MSKISVVVPVYNAEPFLSQCIESILNQTHRDIELILVDDGSPDNCPKICDSYAVQDTRVRVIHKENGGVSTARNAGLDATTGEYVTFVDSDDYIDATMYEKMMDVVRAYSCDIVMCDCVKEFADHRALYTHDIRPGFYNIDQLKAEYYPHLLMMENVEYPATTSNCLMLFPRQLAENLRYLTGVRYSEDLLFGAQLMYNAQSFFYMKGQAYYHYRINAQSATQRFAPNKWRDYQELHQGIRSVFGSCGDFDFSRQIDLCLLFFLYNALSDILNTNQLANSEKKEKIQAILNDISVRDMFRDLEIGKLPISLKQKLITHLYKNRWAIGLLCAYYERK